MLINDIISELKQTTWLKPIQLANLLIYTMLICGIIAFMALGLDFIFFKLRDLIL